MDMGVMSQHDDRAAARFTSGAVKGGGGSRRGGSKGKKAAPSAISKRAGAGTVGVEGEAGGAGCHVVRVSNGGVHDVSFLWGNVHLAQVQVMWYGTEVRLNTPTAPCSNTYSH